MPSKRKEPTAKLKPATTTAVDEFADMCAALDASGRSCGARTKETSMWCPRHDEERIKLYINYKAHHSALDAFPEHSICHSSGAISGCTSFETVRAWNKALLTKYQLLNRCISARSYFTERFFGNDMDFGHKTFWHSLLKQLHKIESLLEHVEKRACEIVLEAQNALWVLELQSAPPESPEDDCSGHDDGLFSATRKPNPNMDIADVEDPLDVALREKCNLLWEKIKTRLARYCAPSISKYYSERLKIIDACVRRAIYTDPKLLVAAQNYTSVTALLTDATLDLRIVEKLWHAIRHLYVHEVRAAIDDVLRPKYGPGEYVELLGGRVYKNLSRTPFPFHAWGHMTALFMCYFCVRRVCKTVEEIVALTHFVVLTMPGISQSYLKYEWASYEGSKVLTLCGFLPNAIDNFGPRSEVSKCNCVYDGAPHWAETATSYVLAGGLPLGDPKAQQFVNKCLRDPALMVLVRKGRDGRIIRSAPRIWAERVRHASTRAGLRTADWDSSCTLYYQDSVLEEACPKVAADPDSVLGIEECFQLVLVDGSGSGSMADFVEYVSRVWLEVYGCRDVVTLMGEIAMPHVRSGEIEFITSRGKTGKKGATFVVSNLETDVLAAYKRLWGKAPVELADDDILERLPLPGLGGAGK